MDYKLKDKTTYKEPSKDHSKKLYCALFVATLCSFANMHDDSTKWFKYAFDLHDMDPVIFS